MSRSRFARFTSVLAVVTCVAADRPAVHAQSLVPTARRVIDIGGFPNGTNPSNFIEFNGIVYGQVCPLGVGCELFSGSGLVRDINPGGLNSNPQAFTVVNGRLLFVAQDVFLGNELWATDGTSDGTVRVKDIRPGGAGSNPALLTRIGNTLFFAATDGANNTELWRSDGTEAGTVRVKDINGGASADVSDLVNVNGVLFFTAADAASGRELWRSDGTDAGTVRVKDIEPGGAGSSPINLTNVNGTLFFITRGDAGTDGDLSKSDGTEAGTVRVKDLVTLGPGQWPQSLVAVNSTLFFSFADADGPELWTSNGTDAGTVRVKDIRPGPTGSNPTSLTAVNGTVFFAADDGVSGSELWKSNGTEAGTVRVRDIFAGPTSSGPSDLIHFSGILYFVAAEPATGRELWKSDGTEAGTVLAKDIGQGPAGSNIGALTVVNSSLLVFRANDFIHGLEPWVVEDGEVSLGVDLDDRFSSSPSSFATLNGVTYFVASDVGTGTELGKTDGTEAGTVLVKDIRPGGANSSPSLLIAVGGTLFFTADDGTSGRELWKSDGTAAGTVRVKDINPGGGNSNPTLLTNYGDQLFFAANDGVHGNELWKSDGTDAGTVRLGGINPSGLLVAGPTLYMATQPVPGFSGFSELWTSDGTPAGTVRLSDPNGFSGVLDFATGAAALDGHLYFAANGAGLGLGTELWRSDGTPAGTVLVKDIHAGFGSSSPQYLVRLGGALYFRATDAANGTEVWRTDGTAPGTQLLKDINPGSNNSLPQFLTNAGSVFYFSANEGINGPELWKSDGTPAGTVLVKDIQPGGIGSNPQVMTMVGDRLYFAARDLDRGQELWTSDGTPAGTFVVRNLSGRFDGGPQNLWAAGNILFFSAQDGEDGRELWKVTLDTFTPTAGDSDGDGLPDTWETQFGLDPNSAASEQGPTGDLDNDEETNADEFAAGTHPRGFHRRALAEGALNAFFDTRLALLNTGSATAHLLVTFQQGNGQVLTQIRELPPLQRRTITRDDLTGLTSPDFSTLIESDEPFVLDRTMSWDASAYGAHAETGVPEVSPTWYLAEGSTSGDFALFYLLQNPHPFEATATIRYLLPFGLPPIERRHVLPPSSRTTIPVDTEAPELEHTDVSAVIEATEPIIVERAMYMNRPGQPFAAGHGSAGVTAPAREWFLAEGATGPFFDLFVLIANPNETPAEVEAEYRLIGGGLLTKRYTVPANGRFTIWVDAEELPAGSGQKPLANVAVSTTIKSTNGVPVIVERTMWWPGPETTSNFWYESHNSPGVTGTGTRWALAEGELGGARGYETYILIANTSDAAGQAKVTLYFEDGSSTERTYDLAPNSRTNVQVSVDFPEASGKQFGALVESLGTTPAPIVVERAMYWSTPDAIWSAGTNARGSRLQ